MKRILADIGSFFRDDLLPNIGHYLLQGFMLLVVLIVFVAITIVVRLLIDPLLLKVFRLREDSRLPGFLALVLSLVVLGYALIFAANRFAPVRPTVVGRAGEQLREWVQEHDLPGADLGRGERRTGQKKPKKARKVGLPPSPPAPPNNP